MSAIGLPIHPHFCRSRERFDIAGTGKASGEQLARCNRRGGDDVNPGSTAREAGRAVWLVIADDLPVLATLAARLTRAWKPVKVVLDPGPGLPETDVLVLDVKAVRWQRTKPLRRSPGW